MFRLKIIMCVTAHFSILYYSALHTRIELAPILKLYPVVNFHCKNLETHCKTRNKCILLEIAGAFLFLYDFF